MKLTNQQLRRKLLEGMCDCAENMHMNAIFNQAIKVIDGWTPVDFKPGIADKFLFNKIIDERFEEIKKIARGQNPEYIINLGRRLYLESYCPGYAEFRQVTEKYIEEAIERYLNIEYSKRRPKK